MSEPIAWLLTNGAGTAIRVFLSESGAKRYASSNGMGKFPVTPLVAAPPEDGRPSYADLVEALRAFLGSDEMGMITRSHVRQHARALLSRIPPRSRSR